MEVSYTDKINALKQNVRLMLSERSEKFKRDDSQCPSPIWSDSLSLFSYMINLSAEDFLNVRFHGGYFSGSNVLQHWYQYPPIDPERYADMTGYKFHTRDVPRRYWIGEPPTPRLPRPLGIDYRGRLINIDICRYQSCISNLYSMGILDMLSRGSYKKIVVEIGAGYGGLAHQLGKIMGNKCTYIILDLPEILLFSGGYLIVNNPEKSIYVYNKETFTPEFIAGGMYEYDYVLLPNYVLKDLYAMPEVSLMINMQSFQEMTREQINEYLEFAHNRLLGYLYSDNMDKHPFNDGLGTDTITSLLAERFRLFPPPEYYKKIIGHDRVGLYSWQYKPYVGIRKDQNLPWRLGGTIKVVDKMVRYSFINSMNGVKFKAERAWLGYLVAIGLWAVQLVLSRRNKRQKEIL